MATDQNYFAYCLDTNTKENYFIVPSKFLKPRPDARISYPGVASDTLGKHFGGAVFQSAWHESLEVDPDDGIFLDQTPDKDFEHLLTDAEYKKCLVLATASSFQELQEFVQSVNIKVPNKHPRLDDSIALGSQQHDEPENPEPKKMISTPIFLQNNQLTSSESNLQMGCIYISNFAIMPKEPISFTSLLLPEIQGKLPISKMDEKDNTHNRSEGVANLGFFESELDGRVTKQNADNVCVLVIHYEFKNNPEHFRKGDACDVKRLKTFFGENRNCNFRNFRSPNKKTLLQLLGDQEKLFQFFNLQDDVPSVFVLFILSHGSENGIIWTAHVDCETNKYEYFTTDEVLDSLQKLKRFEKCLKVVNFGPSRGSLDDSKFHVKNSYENYNNRNSCRITNRPGMRNFVVFYSTVETTLANTDENGSWFVRNICTSLNHANDEPLLNVHTAVQNRMHQASRSLIDFEKNTSLGQTPELKMYEQDRKFIISKTKIQENFILNTLLLNEHYSWKSDEGQDIRGRRGFILSVAQSKQVQEMKRVLLNIDFEIKDWILSGQSMEFYLKTVSDLDPDVGCIMTCILGPVCENEQKEVCVRVQKGQQIPITDILHSLVGPKNDKLIGKPKILFVVNMDEPKTDYRRVCPNDELVGKPKKQIFVNVKKPRWGNISPDMKEFQITATNHSGWLVLILKHEDALVKLIEILENIGEKSLQELLGPMLTRESNRKDAVLLNSTLQYLVKFPNWPRAFVKPEFNFKKAIIPRVEIVTSRISTESPIEEKLNFDSVLKKAKSVLEENKKMIASSIMSNPVRCIEGIPAARDLAEESIVWLFNSVAGAGKSTVLKEMAHQLTKYDAGFKILLIPMKKHYQYLFDMPALKVNEIEFLANTTFNFHDDIQNWIEKKELIVFIDGFDEVCPDFREKIIKILIALNQASVPIFIGTRPHEVHHIQDRIKNTTIIEIEPLDEAKQIEFLRIVGRKNQQEIEQLMKIFKNQDILGNPLYLTLLTEHSGDGNLYDIFDKIVRGKVEICLKRENGGKDIGEQMLDKSLTFFQLVASRFVTGVKIDQGSVKKEDLEKMNAFGFVSYYDDRVDFTHQMFAEFLTSQKFINDLKNPVAEEVPLLNEELVQCRKFVDLFFSTEKGKDETYAEAFVDWAKSTDPLKLIRQICGENLKHMLNLLNPDLSLKDEDGKNALHFALRHLEMVKMVHKNNDKLANQETNYGESCLHLAIDDEECSEEVALWLLQNKKVDKNAENRFGDTPLLLAGARQKWEVVQQLVFTNVEVNKRNRMGKSILHLAVQSNKLDLIQQLLDRGSDVQLKDYSGATALHIAARWNENPATVDILLKNGAKVNAQDKEKQTALHYATKNPQNTEIVRTLLGNSADVHSKDQEGRTALHLAAWWNENPEILRILIDNGAGVNAKDNYDWTALHYAARFNPNPEVVQILLDNGAEINAENDDEENALFLADMYNPVKEVSQKLLDLGAEVNEMINSD